LFLSSGFSHIIRKILKLSKKFQRKLLTKPVGIKASFIILLQIVFTREKKFTILIIRSQNQRYFLNYVQKKKEKKSTCTERHLKAVCVNPHHTCFRVKFRISFNTYRCWNEEIRRRACVTLMAERRLFASWLPFTDCWEISVQLLRFVTNVYAFAVHGDKKQKMLCALKTRQECAEDSIRQIVRALISIIITRRHIIS